jgi:hypothetical protein
MTERHDGRWTAELDDEGVVLFMVGMRVNKAWRLDRWIWVPFAMRRMVRHLLRHPEAGMISARNWFGRTTVQIAYWRDVDALIAFASEKSAPHAAAWRKFNRVVGASGAVGIWHETYLVGPGRAESVYVNMPAFGLAEATRIAQVDKATNSSRRRLAKPATPLAAPASTAAACPVHRPE